MSSPLLALFARSLREDVRLKMTYFTRVGLVSVILLFLLANRSDFGWGNAPGLRFFGNVIFINFFFIVLAGFSYFASAITEEKEEMTLGLLRMTNLNPLSILLGKSTSRLIGALLLLLAQFPFTLLAIALGGVAVRQILAAYCTLGAFIIFVCNLALLASVVCRRTGSAAVLTFLTLLGFFGVVPLVRWIVMLPVQFGLIKTPGAWLVLLGEFADFVSLASPFNRLTAILATGFAETPMSVQVWTNLALGAGCFLLAWAVFEIFCREQQESGPSRQLVARRKSLLQLNTAGRVWKRALAWKDFYFLAGGKLWIAGKLLIYALIPAAVLFVPRRWNQPVSVHDLGYVLLSTSALIGYLELAFTAGVLFSQERKGKTLSTLVMLPISIRRLCYQKVLGCLPALLPAALYFLIGLVCVSDDLAKELGDVQLHPGGGPDFEDCCGIALAVLLPILFLHLVAWLSLYVKRGALPLAVAVTVLSAMFFALLSELTRHETAGLFLLVLGAVTGLFVLHRWIGWRLEQLAAED